LQVGFVATMPTSQEFDQCKGYLEQGSTLNVAEFTAWFGAHNDGEWVKETEKDGGTPLHHGMEHNAPAEVLELLRSFSLPFDVCTAYLKQGPSLNVAEFAEQADGLHAKACHKARPLRHLGFRRRRRFFFGYES
jgi:hypothetical protein